MSYYPNRSATQGEMERWNEQPGQPRWTSDAQVVRRRTALQLAVAEVLQRHRCANRSRPRCRKLVTNPKKIRRALRLMAQETQA